MNIVLERERLHYGFDTSKRYNLVLKTLKCYWNDEIRAPEPNPESPVFACRFCHISGYEHMLALANEDGAICIQNTKLRSQDSSAIVVTHGHFNAIFDLAWSNGNDMKLVSVSGDHTAVLWDIAMPTHITKLCTFKGHTRSIKTVTFRPDDKDVFATGARDGTIMLWDSRNSQNSATCIKPDNAIINCHLTYSVTRHVPGSGSVKMRQKFNKADSITGLVFRDQYHLISCSAGDGLLKVWDIRKCYYAYKREPLPCYTMQHPGNSAKNSFTSLVLSPDSLKLYANCLDDTVYCYNTNTFKEKPIATYTGHLNSTFYVKSCLSSDGQYLVSGSSDEKAYIWDVSKPGKPIAYLAGHTAEVTCVDWCRSADLKLVTCGDDVITRIWRVQPGNVDQGAPHEVVGWVETITTDCQDGFPNIMYHTPRALKRAVLKGEKTPVASRDMTGSSGKCFREDGCLSELSQNIMSNKGARRLFDPDAGGSESETLSPASETFSPTSNLPNYVMDGTSPHHVCSRNHQKENQNWLLKLQQVTPTSNTNRNRSGKKRRTNQSSAQKKKRVSGNLLQFFAVKSKKESPITDQCKNDDDLNSGISTF